MVFHIATPPRLAPWLQSLPPSLHIKFLDSIPNYSKAPRGLSVLLRVTGIFTGCVISPDLSLRQCPDRYAIRAGRNLPDKEFRLKMLHYVFHNGAIISVALYMSPCRPDHIFTDQRSAPRVWSLRILNRSMVRFFFRFI